jgi:hypothetical protein
MRDPFGAGVLRIGLPGAAVDSLQEDEKASKLQLQICSAVATKM